MRYRFMVSYNLGMSYQEALASDDLDDPEFKKHEAYCDDAYLRYYIADESGEMVGLSAIHRATLDLLGGSAKPYKQRDIGSMVSDLQAHFGSRQGHAS